MAQQNSLVLDREQVERKRQGILPTGASGVRTPNFLGGETDPETGNIVPGSAVAANRGVKPTGSEIPKPKTPTTPLGNVEATPIPAPTPSYQPAPSSPATPVSIPAVPAPAVYEQGQGDGSGQTPNSSYHGYDTSSLPSAPPGYEGLAGGFYEGANNGGGGGGGGGGTVLCTHYFRLGLLPRRVYVADMAYGARHAHPDTLRGYHLWAIPLARLLRTGKFPKLERALFPAVSTWAHEMAAIMGVRGVESTFAGRALRSIAEPACRAIGFLDRKVEAVAKAAAPYIHNERRTR